MVKSFMLRGEASYAKILGKAPPGYDNGPAEWTFDLILDEKGVSDYLASGGDKFYLKTNPDNGNQYLKFKRKAQRKDGSESTPIAVVGPDGKEWNQKTLIGNKSILNVKYALGEIEHKKVKRLKPSVIAVQVWEHKKYEGNSGFQVNPTIPVENWSEDAA